MKDNINVDFNLYNLFYLVIFYKKITI